jgi:hypothetical protein
VSKKKLNKWNFDLALWQLKNHRNLKGLEFESFNDFWSCQIAKTKLHVFFLLTLNVILFGCRHENCALGFQRRYFGSWLVPQLPSYQIGHTSVRNLRRGWFVSLLQTMKQFQLFGRLKLEVIPENEAIIAS